MNTTIKWNQAGEGNVHVTDGGQGYWATVPSEWTVEQALDEYMSTADYSEATATFTVRAHMLDGRQHNLAHITVSPEV